MNAESLFNLFKLKTKEDKISIWSLNQFESALNNGLLFLESDQNGNLTGCVIAESVGEDWEITNIFIHPNFRRKGIATQLLKRAIDKIGGKKLFLEVHSKNRIAQELYIRLGFEEVGKRPSYYRDGADAILYTYSKGPKAP